MQGVLVTAFEGPDALVVRELPEPEAQEGQVLIDVEWADVIFPDLLQTRGEYQTRPELPFVPGWEVSGTVRTDGAGFRAGDRVAALPVTGGFAQTVAVDATMVFPLPDNVDTRRGAALPLNYLTAHFALVHRGALRPGEVVLVHGAAGGVGSAACQVAAAHGARVIAVVSTEEKAELARSVGAHEVVDVGGFLDEVRNLTDGQGVDLVVNPVGGIASRTRFARCGTAWGASSSSDSRAGASHGQSESSAADQHLRARSRDGRVLATGSGRRPCLLARTLALTEGRPAGPAHLVRLPPGTGVGRA
jgi:NADPH2:quinone reductase